MVDVEDALEFVHEMEEKLYENKLISSSNEKFKADPGFIKLERSLLHIGAVESAVQGMFYMFPVYAQGKLFLR